MVGRVVTVVAAALLLSCSKAPKKTRLAPPPTVATVAPAASSLAPVTATRAPELDLSIAFHPGLSTNIGWAALPEPLPLYMLGNSGASHVRGAAYYADTKLEPYEQEGFAFQLKAVDLEKTSLELQESTLCSNALRTAVDEQRPARLLINIKWGLTTKAVSCLKALPVKRFYLTGCLQRSHRRDDVCDGDAELAALIAEPDVRERTHGLALSLSKEASVRSLEKVPTLEYLAVVAGRDAEQTADFDALPFAALQNLRYLDITNWKADVWAFHPTLLAFLGRLHTLEWNGRLKVAIPDCKLRRLSQATRSDDDSPRSPAAPSSSSSRRTTRESNRRRSSRSSHRSSRCTCAVTASRISPPSPRCRI